MRVHLPAAAVCAAFALVCVPALPAAADGGSSVAFHISDPRITESSGLVASRLHPGVYWTHNDSGDGPYVYAVDAATGKTVATVTMRGIHPRDVEAISIGPDGDLYVGDIGDNLDGTWPEVWIYRFAEPRRLTSQTVDATRFTVRYSDGPRNAEALMVRPGTGRVYIASKNQDGGHLYEGPARLSAGGVNVFHRVGDVPWVTDGSFSPDGSRLVLRGYFWASEYRWTAGRPAKIDDLDVPIQPQGESVTFTTDGRAVMYGSEGRDSEVWKESLSGDDLPADAAAKPTATGTAAAGGNGHSGTQDTSGSGTHSPATRTADKKTGNKVLGFAVLLAIGAAGMGARRAMRRRRGH